MRAKSVTVLSCIFMLFVFGSLMNARAQAGKWSSYFKLKSGQFFKYQMKSERGLAGWASIKIDDAGGGALNVTLAGRWTKDFSETVRMKPGMSAFDFIYAAKDMQITNALAGLVNVEASVIENAQWKDGFKWAQGDSSIVVSGQKECAGVKGLCATSSSKSFGRAQKRTYCVNPDLPLPIFVEVPAANDTWTYELVEKKGV